MSDPTEKALAIPESRMRFLRLLHGAADEMSDDSVPEERRDAFNDDVAYNREFAERWFERNCKHYGSPGGDWAGVPAENHAEALRYFGRKIALHDNRCEFELDLLKIDQEEALERAFDKSITALAARK